VLPQNANKVSSPSSTARTQEENNSLSKHESNSAKDKEPGPDLPSSSDSAGQKVAAKAKRSRKEENRVATNNNKRRKTKKNGKAAVTYVELPSDWSPADTSDDDEAVTTANNKKGIDQKTM
jgi:hypothetical protein